MTPDSITIRDCNSTKDNDELSMASNPKSWWLYVSGCPGSHVVVYHEGKVVPKETKRDAVVQKKSIQITPIGTKAAAMKIICVYIMLE